MVYLLVLMDYDTLTLIPLSIGTFSRVNIAAPYPGVSDADYDLVRLIGSKKGRTWSIMICVYTELGTM